MEELLRQSQVRGKHATGIAYYDGNSIEIESKPIPAERFTELYEFPDSEYMIGHVRYSTSDLKYNQPLMEDNVAIVHNGIITQEDPENWIKHFEYDNYKTKNDSEILLKCLKSDNIFHRELVFKKFENSSIAVGILRNRRMYCMRNTTRPLWIFESKLKFDGIKLFSGFASTKDIIQRTFNKLDLDVKIIETKPYIRYIFNDDGSITEKELPKPSNEYRRIEQQIPTKNESKYV